MSIQQDVAQYVKDRGYHDGLDSDQLACRHVAKLAEELGEIAIEVDYRTFADGHLHWGEYVNRARWEARSEFDDLDAWRRYRIIDREQMKAELADLQVVILSMAEVMGFDVLATALEKAQADVERGVR